MLQVVQYLQLKPSWLTPRQPAPFVPGTPGLRALVPSPRGRGAGGPAGGHEDLGREARAVTHR